jgi:tetratricopeptide (TPR) repeat protein
MFNPNRILRKSVQARLENVSINMRTAKKNMLNSNYERAVQFAAKVCIVDEHCVEARYLKGFCYRNLGEFSKAIETYKQIIDLIPGSAVAHLYLADCLRNAGRTDEAIEYYLHAMRLDTEGDIRELARESVLSIKESQGE